MSKHKSILALIFGASILAAPLTASASDQSPALCDEAILMSYFPAPFVEKTLDKHNVPQGQREAILKELAEKDKEVIALVEEKAAKMPKNPLRDPSLRQEAIKIFRDTLYELFSKTMQAHGTTNREEILVMLDEVQRQKAEYFAKCMEHAQKERGPANNEPSQPLKREGQAPNEE